MPPTAKGKPGPTPPPESTTIIPSGEPQVDGVLSGRFWANYSGTDLTTVTYSFPNSYTDYGKGYSEASSRKYVQLNEFEQDAVRSILGDVQDFANLIFVENTGTSDGSAQIRVGNTVTPGADAWAYYPGSGKGGDVWFDKNGGGSGLMSREEADLQPGDYTYTVYMHELGHALGLKHSFENTSFGVVPIDSLEYTVMSYDAYVGAPNTWATDGNNPQTFMMYDIAALQYMYGANYATNGDDTTYMWSPVDGELAINGTPSFDAPDTNNIFMTLWDGGGNDTYDFSNYDTDLMVDLQPGGWTTLDTQAHHQLADLSAGGDGSVLAAGNIANALVFDWNDDAPGAGVIENATGGAGDDTLIGNDVANVLSGGSGHDSFVLDSAMDATTNVDTITDFVIGDDLIVLDDAVFSELDQGALDSASFVAGTDPVALEADDYVLYDTGTWALYYDADGSDATVAVQFATLTSTPTLAASDIWVV